MPGATPIYGLPFAILGDPPHGPNQTDALASAVEALLNGTYKTERDNVIAAAIAALLSGKAGQQSVATSQNTTSTSYTDLTTVGPRVALTSAGTRAFCIWKLTQSTTSGSCASSVKVSGATTLAATDAEGIVGSDSGRNITGWSLLTITPGSNTFDLQYRVTGGTGSFADRKLMVFAP